MLAIRKTSPSASPDFLEFLFCFVLYKNPHRALPECERWSEPQAKQLLAGNKKSGQLITPMESVNLIAAATKYEAECTTNETHRWVSLDGP